MIKEIKRRFLNRLIIRKLINDGNDFNLHCDIDSSTCMFEGHNHVGDGSILRDTVLGYATYVGDHSLLMHAAIGKYTSIGSRVYVIIGSHPSRNNVSTHPLLYAKSGIGGVSYLNKDLYPARSGIKENQQLHIGNDVWIGDGVSILAGIHIADGTIIAAGAVITKDTEPYSVVGGVPAKVIRYRFEEDDIIYLMNLQWWNKGEDWIRKNAELFCDIKYLRKALGN